MDSTWKLWLQPTLPAIGGSEAVGVIDALGEGVTHVQVGQRIAVASVHGSWAEYLLHQRKGYSTQ